eukprot:gene4711-9341_t
MFSYIVVALVVILSLSSAHIVSYNSRAIRVAFTKPTRSTTSDCDCPTPPTSLDIYKFSEIPFVSISGAPTDAELSDENLVRIVLETCTDYEVDLLVWKCLGYRYSAETETWNSDGVFPKWRAKYPSPIDLVGLQRNYDQIIDKPVRTASVELIRSIPHTYKGRGVKSLSAVGFKGYKLNELTPNKTRRAQLVNWLLYYRDNFYGKTFEQIVQERVPLKVFKEDDDEVLPSERCLFNELEIFSYDRALLNLAPSSMRGNKRSIKCQFDDKKTYIHPEETFLCGDDSYILQLYITQSDLFASFRSFLGEKHFRNMRGSRLNIRISYNWNWKVEQQNFPRKHSDAFQTGHVIPRKCMNGGKQLCS